jgi:hypothetical protein
VSGQGRFGIAAESAFVSASLLALLLVSACGAAYPPPAPVDHGAFRERAVVETTGPVTVAAAIPDEDESLAIFGINLGSKDIQPIWLEIANGSERPFVFLPTGLDTEYFAPNETSFLFADQFDSESQETLSIFLEEVSLTSRDPIEPGETARGFVFVNRVDSTAVVDVVLVGPRWSETIALFVPVPGAGGVAERADTFRRLADTVSGRDIEEETALRRALERLPCRTDMSNGDGLGPPLNVVFVGDLETVMPAFGRRLYRLSDAEPLRLFGREQDLAGRKSSRWTPARPHFLRLWMTGLRYRNQPIMVGQIAMPRGGRFARDQEGEAALDPRTDVARDALVQDLVYSQALARIGYIKAKGERTAGVMEGCAATSDFQTDGLRAVMIFQHEPVSLAEIDFLDWERLADHRAEAITPP